MFFVFLYKVFEQIAQLRGLPKYIYIYYIYILHCVCHCMLLLFLALLMQLPP